MNQEIKRLVDGAKTELASNICQARAEMRTDKWFEASVNLFPHLPLFLTRPEYRKAFPLAEEEALMAVADFRANPGKYRKTVKAAIGGLTRNLAAELFVSTIAPTEEAIILGWSRYERLVVSMAFSDDVGMPTGVTPDQLQSVIDWAGVALRSLGTDVLSEMAEYLGEVSDAEESFAEVSRMARENWPDSRVEKKMKASNLIGARTATRQLLTQVRGAIGDRENDSKGG